LNFRHVMVVACCNVFCTPQFLLAQHIFWLVSLFSCQEVISIWVPIFWLWQLFKIFHIPLHLVPSFVVNKYISCFSLNIFESHTFSIVYSVFTSTKCPIVLFVSIILLCDMFLLLFFIVFVTVIFFFIYTLLNNTHL